MALPQHLAIIMDGNGRWAQGRGKPRTFGHVKGTRVAKKIITECSRRGIHHLTLYAFSAENWLRPQGEVNLLMKILERYLHRETENLIKENIRFSVIGEMDLLPLNVLEVMRSSMEATASCTGLHLIFALSYGSRQEITAAARNLAQLVHDGRLQVDQIDERTMQNALWTGAVPNPDFIIRTSGEKRLSNFLLWQSAYSELWFTDVLWPDFTVQHLNEALQDYAGRQRRFGRLESKSDELHS